jgi:hypothetical protein
MDGPRRHFKYCLQHMRVQNCGSSNWWRVSLFRFLSLLREKAIEKNGYKTVSPFCSYFGINAYLSSQKVRTTVFHIRGKSVFSTVWFTITVFIVFSFHGNSELWKTKMADLLSMIHHRAPRMDQCIIFFLPFIFADCRYRTNCEGRHLNLNDSTPVFTSYSIITASSTEFKAKIL